MPNNEHELRERARRAYSALWEQAFFRAQEATIRQLYGFEYRVVIDAKASKECLSDPPSLLIVKVIFN